ncbi:MAG TPA: hypothetical protein VJ376_07720 [Pseudomonadota bacterium]|nr:hypothetical protein [Pseudomonadota bacterium]
MFDEESPIASPIREIARMRSMTGQPASLAVLVARRHRRHKRNERLIVTTLALIICALWGVGVWALVSALHDLAAMP